MDTRVGRENVTRPQYYIKNYRYPKNAENGRNTRQERIQKLVTQYQIVSPEIYIRIALHSLSK